MNSYQSGGSSFAPETPSSADVSPMSSSHLDSSIPLTGPSAPARESSATAATPFSPARPSRKYDAFGSLNRSSSDSHVAEWLRSNGFDVVVVSKLHGFEGVDILALSKDDLRALLGTKDGIRLFNRLKQVREALAALGADRPDAAEQARVASSASAAFSPATSARAPPAFSLHHGAGPEDTPPGVASGTWASALGSRGSGNSRRNGLAGLGVVTHATNPCEVATGCTEAAIARCSNEQCDRHVCLAHAAKDIFTSYYYCPRCEDEFSYSARLTKSRLHDMLCKVQ